MYICMCVYCIVCSAFVCGRFVYSWSRITVVQRRPQKPLNATSQHLNFKKFPGGTCPQTPLELGRVAASCLLLWSGPGITDILATPLSPTTHTIHSYHHNIHVMVITNTNTSSISAEEEYGYGRSLNHSSVLIV